MGGQAQKVDYRLKGRCKVSQVREPPTDLGWVWEKESLQWGKLTEEMEKSRC